MAAQFDESDFVDGDFVATQKTFASPAFAPPSAAPASPPPMNRPPTREEIESKVNEAQSRLAELRRAQEELERQRASLEEARRRRIEFQNGRAEMLQHLTRGVGLLEESEFGARRQAEQMLMVKNDLQAALEKVQGMREDSWTEENWLQELTRALTTLENARMEWNAARLKFTMLDGAMQPPAAAESGSKTAPLLQGQNFLSLCRIGLALTWPVALVTLVSAGIIIALLFLRK